MEQNISHFTICESLLLQVHVWTARKRQGRGFSLYSTMVWWTPIRIQTHQCSG